MRKVFLNNHEEQSLLFFKDFIYLFLERGEGREGEREKHGWLPFACPNWRPSLQPWHVP